MTEFYRARSYTEAYTVAVTIASEVGPDSTEIERRAVASVIRNRAMWNDQRPLEVVTEPKQFSGVGEPYWFRYFRGESMEQLVNKCYMTWHNVWHGPEYIFPISVRWYYSPVGMPKDEDGNPTEPSWAKRLKRHPTEAIDEHRFKFYEDPDYDGT